jgi:uncharacterized protein
LQHSDDPFMSDAKSQQAEPSMEEILASIRRIISEDSADAGKGQPAAAAAAPAAPAPPAPPQPAPVAAPSAPAPEVLELTEMVGDDGKVTEIVEEKPSAPPPSSAAPVADDGDRLVSRHAASAAAGALAGLHAASRKSDFGEMRSPVGLGNGGMTLEDIVRTEMRPILKAWLDENLPPLVERLVQREIKRITRQVDET